MCVFMHVCVREIFNELILRLNLIKLQSVFYNDYNVVAKIITLTLLDWFIAVYYVDLQHK